MFQLISSLHLLSEFMLIICLSLKCINHNMTSGFHMSISNSNFTQIIERFNHKDLHQQKDDHI